MTAHFADGRRPTRPGQHGHDRNHGHTPQRVPPVDVRPWIFPSLKRLQNLIQPEYPFTPRASHNVAVNSQYRVLRGLPHAS